MTLNLKLDGALHEAHRVEIFQLDFRPELFIADATHGDVRLATQVALLHISFRCADPLQRAAHMVDVIVSLPRRTKIRLRHNLRERRARAVEVYVRVAVNVRQTFMDVLARVFFEVQPRDANLLDPPLARVSGLVALGSHNLQLALFGKRLVELRNLIALRQVRIKIILPRKDRTLVDA